MNLMRKRAEITLRAMTANAHLERAVVARACYRIGRIFGAGANGLHRLEHRVDSLLKERLQGRRALPYFEWLAQYHPIDAPSPAGAMKLAPAIAVLYPAAASATALLRCLETLRRQDKPCQRLIALCPTRRGRHAMRAAARRAGWQNLVVAEDEAALKAHLATLDAEQTLLLLKGAPLLRRRAHGALAAALHRSPTAHAAYGDEDETGRAGLRKPLFKPGFSPVLGRQYDYVGNVALFRAGFFLRAVLCDLGLDRLPAWIGDGFLTQQEVIHLPELLHAEPRQRRLTYVSGETFDKCLAEAANRLPALPSATIIIPTKNLAGMLRNCVESIMELTRYERAALSLMIVDNGSTTAEALELLAALEDQPGVTVLRRPAPFNYSWLCNEGAAAATADILLFMNNDIVIRDPDWLAKLVGAAVLPTTGVVGCKLLYPSGRVQHAGVVLGIQGLAGHVGVGAAANDGVYFGVANHSHEVSAVTGALIALRAELFHAAGGYNEALAVAFSDTELCLACNRLGGQTLYLQSALALHFESASRGDDGENRAKQLRLLNECQVVLSRNTGFKTDPFYNTNLSLMSTYEIADPPRAPLALRRGRRDPRVLMLSSTFEFGRGVAVVVETLSHALEAGGAEVLIGAPRRLDDLQWPAEKRLEIDNPQQAAQLAARHGADVVIAHTPPFFGTFKTLPLNIAGIAYDHGEPPPDLFPDAMQRRLINAEKFGALRYADRVLAISTAIRDENPVSDCGVICNGNTHLARWSPGSPAKRIEARRLRGWGGQLVILNVCRFSENERHYKGIDFYMNLRRALELLHPEVAATTRMVLAGRGTRQDVALIATAGIDVIADPSDEALADLYHAADTYMSFSRWEGYNLGIGQALAFGLPVVASDIPAHRAFGIPIAATLAEAVAAIVQAFLQPWRGEQAGERRPVLHDWSEAGALLRAEIGALLAAKVC